MWNFLPGGLLMPAAVPMDLADPKFTHDGEFDLQVRGRVASHLTNFTSKYMEPGTYSEIEYTPQMDYNVRFYTTRDHFAWAMGKAIADIDYEKFKPEAERPEFGADGKQYHGVLNAIWGSVTALGSPGGSWANWDTKYSGKATTLGSSYKGFSGTVSRGQRFDDDLLDTPMPEAGTPEFDAWWEQHNVRSAVVEEDPDWSPEESYDIAAEDAAWLREQLLEEASAYSIPLEKWKDYFTASEFALIKDDHKAFLEARRRQAKKNRAKRRRARNRRLRDQ